MFTVGDEVSIAPQHIYQGVVTERNSLYDVISWSVEGNFYTESKYLPGELERFIMDGAVVVKTPRAPLTKQDCM